MTWELDPAEAFTTLGNETRLDVLRALWEADEAMRYTSLRREVAPDDRGNFGYHLSKLTGHFVQKSNDGYELRLAGEQVVRAVIAGTITANPSLPSQTVDDECTFCGAPVEFQYDDETITVSCTDCEGLVGGDLPRGTFIHYEFPPGGLAGRDAAEIVDAAHVFYDAKVIPMLRGICPICAGQIESTIEHCEDHDAIDGELCVACETRNETWAVLRCERCYYTRRVIVWFAALTHPGVISFYYDHGIDESIPVWKLPWERLQIDRHVDVDVIEREPYLFDISIRIDDDTLSVRMGGDLTVRTIEREPPEPTDVDDGDPG
ncbi:helix-turn-helix domain-containing protein [Halovivax cerinus]|uniref:Helix-turn-helix domain-containing protein n=1 Tax=Halovivax cerinus TaxID=1487865 RepID=A0ABD5NK65_9EURY|nr:helix-turn-helix domain-containing protein [Halovivax cerinus]